MIQNLAAWRVTSMNDVTLAGEDDTVIAIRMIPAKKANQGHQLHVKLDITALSEEFFRRRPRRRAAVHRSPSIHVEAPRRPSSPPPIEYHQDVQFLRRRSPRVPVEAPSPPSSPSTQVVQLPSTPPSPITADQIPVPSDSSLARKA